MHIIDSIIGFFSALLFSLLLTLGFVEPPVLTVTSPIVDIVATTTATTAAQQETAEGLAQGLPREASLADRRIEDPRGPLSSPVVPAIPPPPPTQPTKSQEQINQETRTSLVNIFCITKYGGYLKPISGSGVIIDTRGVILTNAHIGQYLLLKDYYTPGNVECVVRTGSPAEPRYKVELLFLPPLWVEGNASQIDAAQAVGTGEHDYAFLIITGPTGTDPMPSSFPAITMSSSEPSVGDGELLAAYPAGFLGGETITKSLYASSAVAYTTQLFNFTGGKEIDLFSIGGTVLSQAGSSGGAVVSLQNGALKGVIVTATDAESTGTRDLRAMSVGHINRSLAQSGQGGLVPLLVGDIKQKSAAFMADIAPALTAKLEAEFK